MFPDLGEVALVGDILWGQSAYSTLVTRAICPRGAPCVCCVGSSVVVGPLLWVCWQTGLAPSLVGCQALCCGGCQPTVGQGWVLA